MVIAQPARSTAAPTPQLRPFEAVFEAHGPEIYRYLRRFCPRAEDAADLHQEVFLRAFRAYSRLKPGANVRAWLYRIASNLAIDSYRRRPRAAEGTNPEAAQAEPAATGGDPEARARAVELAAAVRSAVLGLSPSQRLAVCARVFDGASYDEVGRLLDCSEATARQHVSQGLRRLQADLVEWR
jgi:RNA polymerase sigma-70 factor (ECF subfamily)